MPPPYLRIGNVNGALRAFTAPAAGRFRTVFDNLRPNLATIADQLGTLASSVLGEDLAEYTIVRNTPTGKQGFLLYLIRSSDGVWRIDGM